MKLGEKHMHTHIYIHICIYHSDIHISLFIKDVPKNISSLYVKHRDPFTPHRLTVLPNCPLFACFYSLGPTRLETAFKMMWDPDPLNA